MENGPSKKEGNEVHDAETNSDINEDDMATLQNSVLDSNTCDGTETVGRYD